jgi:hypothetical protein
MSSLLPRVFIASCHGFSSHIQHLRRKFLTCQNFSSQLRRYFVVIATVVRCTCDDISSELRRCKGLTELDSGDTWRDNFVDVSTHTWIVDRATKLFRRKKNSAFVEIATNMCGNINEKPSQIWSYVLVQESMRSLKLEDPTHPIYMGCIRL